jgi:hypothetical protein
VNKQASRKKVKASGTMQNSSKTAGATSNLSSQSTQSSQLGADRHARFVGKRDGGAEGFELLTS